MSAQADGPVDCVRDASLLILATVSVVKLIAWANSSCVTAERSAEQPFALVQGSDCELQAPRPATLAV